MASDFELDHTVDLVELCKIRDDKGWMLSHSYPWSIGIKTLD
jgi:hypothetical protein